MFNFIETLERLGTSLASIVVARSKMIVVILPIICCLVTIGVANTKIATNYRVYFSESNPELVSFENFQSTYTKGDNFLFVITSNKGDVFSSQPIIAIEELTKEAWKIPYATRVDSLTNFQDSFAELDDVIIRPLVDKASNLDSDGLSILRSRALSEPLLNGLLVNNDGTAAAVNVVLNYPLLDLEEVPLAANYARNLRDRLLNKYPEISIKISGTSMLNNAFAEAGIYDLTHAVPLMYALLFVGMAVVTRSFIGASMVMSVVILSSASAMGFAGFLGIEMSPISFAAPTVIATIAVADSIHILLSMRQNSNSHFDKSSSIQSAIVNNFGAILITSLTTIVGFLALNTSDSPPFRHLGTISAFGIGVACLLSITFLPALVNLLPFKGLPPAKGNARLSNLGSWITSKAKPLFAGHIVIATVLISFIPSLQFSDDWFKYIDKEIEFRRDSDDILTKFGLSPIEFSLDSGETEGVTDPEYLKKLENFSDFLSNHEHVGHVYSITSILKRLNRNMNGDDESYYKLPDTNQQSSQLILLYEMSLPFGLSLSDRINIDKSASRVTAILKDVTTKESREFIRDSENWLKLHAPSLATHATGPTVMVSRVAERNLDSMMISTAVAIFIISMLISVILKSVFLGGLSIVANMIPILASFGLWSANVGTIGFSIAAVAAVSIGIIVDDTVHFLTQYVRARRFRNEDAIGSVRIAFEKVGYALIANTIILVVGFLSLTTSTFKINVDMGLLTSFSIALSLVFTFFMVGPILVIFDKRKNGVSS